MSTKLAHESGRQQARAPLWGARGGDASCEPAVAPVARVERFLLSSGFLPFSVLSFCTRG
ncbi:hypothetical protein [Pseudomonas songnenensis]|uniref:Uncharacterized protein n=1 Tax=Pseudomonas songnenensis TaxID=1176259 RepID=A0A482U0D2_9PSED|nr:hypothetical protein [Pseudomonas songnenensis]RYJ59437.1 hypothetical protein EJA06_021425 [Pseudomonas songnenensis]